MTFTCSAVHWTVLGLFEQVMQEKLLPINWQYVIFVAVQVSVKGFPSKATFKEPCKVTG